MEKETIYERSLKCHEEWKGKLSVELKMPLKDKNDLSLAYTPGVAEPCRVINKDVSRAYDYTWKGNSVAVVTDGTAVLGLGDIGPEAGLPVMEGKCVLFKNFGGINAVPICLDTKDPKEIISIVKAISPTFGGINLEDISAPRCVEIERTLINELNIPVFHDDQHGTSIVVIAALQNALKLVNKKKEDITVVLSGVGAAGSSIIKMLKNYGVKRIYGFGRNGVVRRGLNDKYDFLKREIAEMTNENDEEISLSDALKKADVFIGVSAPNLLNYDMVKNMKQRPIVFALANPEPEIPYAEAIRAGAIVGTGRSDYPNQINNVLAFPGLFRGALDVRATKINDAMKLAASMAIASLVDEKDLNENYIIPSVFDERVAKTVSVAVAKAAKESGVAK